MQEQRRAIDQPLRGVRDRDDGRFRERVEFLHKPGIERESRDHYVMLIMVGMMRRRIDVRRRFGYGFDGSARGMGF